MNLLGILVGLAALLAFLQQTQTTREKGFTVVPQPNDNPESTKPVDPFPSTFNNVYKKWGDIRNIDWRVLKAIAQMESSEQLDPGEPGPTAGTSYGLMQVNPEQNPRLDWPNDLSKLLRDADLNVKFGSKIFLEWLTRARTRKQAISGYNQGNRALQEPPQGPFSNQAYVDGVMEKYELITKIHPRRETTFSRF